ncbi:MAG TPA: chromate transporter [Stellaceae bacterium]|nr:chromate transporter [Stellaceae bacterium]
MSDPAALGRLAAHLALLSSISFGGVPTVLPDIHAFVVANHWLTDRDFADFLAVSQAIPGPNMILMMSFIGWKVAGLPGAIASACATFAPPCAMYFAAYRLWNRFRDAPWQRLARAGLAPLTAGFVVAGGTVMARTADISWPAVGVTGGAAALLLFTRLNPLWMLGGAGLVGALGVL